MSEDAQSPLQDENTTIEDDYVDEYKSDEPEILPTIIKPKGAKCICKKDMPKKEPVKRNIKYSKFVTCTIPRKIDPVKDKSKFKYEIVVQYRDQDDHLRKRKIRFGSPYVNDLRDIAPQSLVTNKKYSFYRKKLSRYLMDSKDTFNSKICNQEQWPLLKMFWVANYLWSNPALIQNKQDGAHVLSHLENIVQQLQDIQPEVCD